MLTKRSRVSLAARWFGVVLVCSLFVAGWAQPASANTIYTYTGQSLGNFSGGFSCLVGTSCPITGSFTTSQPLGPNYNGSCAGGPPACLPSPVLAYSFTDGFTTWTSSNAFNNPFGVQTDAKGNIASWYILLFQPGSSGLYLFLQTANLPSSTSVPVEDGSGASTLLSNGSTFYAYNLNQPGTWSVSSTPPAPTPEPSGLLLLGSGLISVLGVVRRKWSNIKIPSSGDLAEGLNASESLT
jgi:hypothetical protein